LSDNGNESELTREFVRIFDGVDAIEAYLVRDMLIQAGLHADVRGFDRLTAMGDIPANSWPNVWVPPQQAEKARELVANFVRPKTPVHPWTCTSCQDENPGEFGSCWKCGADSPSLK
jgi:hypothetical protein